MPAISSIDFLDMEQVLQPLLGGDAAIVCCSVTGDPEGLAPVERDAVSAAIPRRKREFAAGRSAARDAMRRLGLPALPVPAGPDRSPIWPSQVVGSISHCQTVCMAVAARSNRWSSVGLDAEDDHGVSPELWPTICRPEELQRAYDLPVEARARWVTRVFSAKEAFYKWSYPQSRTMMEFQDVLIALPSTLDCTHFTAKLVGHKAAGVPHELSGALTTTQGVVVSLVLH